MKVDDFIYLNEPLLPRRRFHPKFVSYGIKWIVKREASILQFFLFRSSVLIKLERKWLNFGVAEYFWYLAKQNGRRERHDTALGIHGIASSTYRVSAYRA